MFEINWKYFKRFSSYHFDGWAYFREFNSRKIYKFSEFFRDFRGFFSELFLNILKFREFFLKINYLFVRNKNLVVVIYYEILFSVIKLTVKVHRTK